MGHPEFGGEIVRGPPERVTLRAMDSKPYLDYLDKEMTIMGILSAFCVAAPAGILVTSIGKDSSVAAQFWASEKIFILAGSILSMLASAFFYKERSLLALYYGLISYAQTGVDGVTRSTSEEKAWLKEANSYATWWPYCCGFVLLFSGFVYYLGAVFFFVAPGHLALSAASQHLLKHIIFWTIPAIAAMICVSETFARTKRNTTIWTGYQYLLKRNREDE